MALTDWLPLIVILLIEFVFGWNHVINKMALNSGMDPFALVFYRQIFAFVALSPGVYREWATRPPLTRPVMVKLIFLSVLGSTVNLGPYIFGLMYTSPTIASGVSNLLPGMTLIAGLFLGVETLHLTTRGGKAKLIGTLVCISGAMVMSFYHGRLVIFEADIYWNRLAESANRSHKDTIVGPFLVLLSCASCAGWLTLQDRLNRIFYAPSTTTALMTLLSIPQIGLLGVGETLITGRSIQNWSMGFNVRLLAAAYSGILVSALSNALTAWVIQKKGSQYTAMFSPMVLIITAFIGWLLLHESIYLGTLLGSCCIVGGVYTFTWGKNQETKMRPVTVIPESQEPVREHGPLQSRA